MGQQILLTTQVPKLGTYNDNLTYNEGILEQNLWRKLFTIRMKYCGQYTLTDDYQQAISSVSTIDPIVNLTEKSALDNINSMCSNEATAIAEEVFNFLSYAKKTVASKHDANATTGEDFRYTNNSSSTDDCGLNF